MGCVCGVQSAVREQAIRVLLAVLEVLPPERVLQPVLELRDHRLWRAREGLCQVFFRVGQDFGPDALPLEMILKPVRPPIVPFFFFSLPLRLAVCTSLGVVVNFILKMAAGTTGA